MTQTNGGKTTANWIAIIVAAVMGTNMLTYNVVRYWNDNTDRRLTKIEESLGTIEAKIDSKISENEKELKFRVEKAGNEHAQYDRRLDRIEVKLGIK